MLDDKDTTEDMSYDSSPDQDSVLSSNTTTQSHTTDVTSLDSSSQAESNKRWYLDAKFRRYWKHYEWVWNWYQRHLTAKHQHNLYNWYHMSQSYMMNSSNGLDPLTPAAYYNNWLYSLYRPFNRHGSDKLTHTHYHHSLNHSNNSKKRKRTSRRKKNPSKLKSNQRQSGVRSPGQSQKRSSTAESEFEMEITEEMLDFFAQSAKHRKERDGKDSAVSEVEDDYADLDASTSVKKTSKLPPAERPGVRRTAEMKILYGTGAAMIHGMETAMQLTFDRSCDIGQSRLWPALPLNLKFD